MNCKTDADRIAYSKQHTCRVNLIRKDRKRLISVILKTPDALDKSKTSFSRQSKFANKNYVCGRRKFLNEAKFLQKLRQ